MTISQRFQPSPHGVDVSSIVEGVSVIVSSALEKVLIERTTTRVTLESPPQSGVTSLVGYAGTIQEITKDEIILVTTCEFRSEKRVPILAALPYIGRYFTSTSIGRDVLARRIPLATIAAIECRGGTKEDGDTDALERIGVDFK